MSGHSSKKHVCIFMGNEHIERRQIQRGKFGKNNVCKSKTFLICDNCGTAGCHACVVAIFNAIPKSERIGDRWCEFVSKHLSLLQTQNVFVDFGHCCEVQRYREGQITSGNRRNASQSGDLVEDTNEKTVRLNNSQRKKTKARRKKLKKTPREAIKDVRYYGHMHFLGANLLVDSPMNGDIDIHGVGTVGEKHNDSFVHGVMHCVLSADTCIRLFQNDIEAKPFSELKSSDNVRALRTVVNVVTAYGMQKSFQVEIIELNVEIPPEKVVMELKGTNDLEDDAIKQSYVFEKGSESEGVDVTMIMGKMPEYMNQDNVLLIMRFHDFVDDHDQNEVGKKIFKELMPFEGKKKVGRSGFEVCRSGGSGGLTSNPFEDKVLQFLRYHPSSTPRRTRAIKIIQKRTTYKLYYIGVTEHTRKVARCTYTPPKSGGSFLLTASEFIELPFYSDFAESKVIAALILDSLSKQEEPIIVARAAVSQELHHINISSKVAQFLCNQDEQLRTQDHACRLASLAMYNEFNKHSIVCYNVGYHFDRFDQGMASLENKVVFNLPDQFLEKHTRHKFLNETRGGCNRLGEFNFALLDWGRSRRHRRQGAIEDGMLQTNETITEGTLNEFFRVNPNMKKAYRDAQQRLK